MPHLMEVLPHQDKARRRLTGECYTCGAEVGQHWSDCQFCPDGITRWFAETNEPYSSEWPGVPAILKPKDREFLWSLGIAWRPNE